MNFSLNTQSLSGLGSTDATHSKHRHGMDHDKDMSKVIDQLKTTNPDLANKLQSMHDAMDQYRKAGVDPKTAREKVNAQFGSLTTDEQNQVKAAIQSLFGSKSGAIAPAQSPNPTQTATLDSDGDQDGSKAFDVSA